MGFVFSASSCYRYSFCFKMSSGLGGGLGLCFISLQAGICLSAATALKVLLQWGHGVSLLLDAPIILVGFLVGVGSTDLILRSIGFFLGTTGYSLTSSRGGDKASVMLNGTWNSGSFSV